MFNKRCCPRQNMCCKMDPIIEPAINNCVEKEYYYDVEHIIPVHTHVINKHIYNHTYKPQFTCSEESQVINNECPNNFMNK